MNVVDNWLTKLRFEQPRAGVGQHADRGAIAEVGTEVHGGEGLLQQAAPAIARRPRLILIAISAALYDELTRVLDNAVAEAAQDDVLAVWATFGQHHLLLR